MNFRLVSRRKGTYGGRFGHTFLVIPSDRHTSSQTALREAFDWLAQNVVHFEYMFNYIVFVSDDPVSLTKVRLICT